MAEDCVPSIISAEYVAAHVLRIRFSDGVVKEVDFAGFIFGNGHPDYAKYKVIGEFLKFEIVDGNLNWDDYSMIFPIEQLHRGRIEI